MNKKITIERLSRPEIWAKAEEFRTRYVDPIDLLPIPIEDIIEFKLGITIIPIEGLAEVSTDIEGFLCHDLKTIYIDNARISKEKFQNRVRFTLAHEIGHYVLHPEQIKKLTFRSIDQWLEFILHHNDDPDLGLFEWQATEFAGRLLVPREQLINAIAHQQDNIDFVRKSYPNITDDEIIDGVSNVICKSFGVSRQVIKKRVDSEEIEIT
jgi:Zn-dependent peptidase ImmA (M78 family)